MRPAPVSRIGEPEQGYRVLHQLAGRRGDLGVGDLRHDAIHPLTGIDRVHWPSRLDGVAPALRRRPGQAVLAAQLTHYDPSTLRRRPGPSHRHRNPGPRDPGAAGAAQRDVRPAYWAAARSDLGRG